MKLIKQLNEVARQSMSRDVFERLVQTVVDQVEGSDTRAAGFDEELMEVIFATIENIAGFEDTVDAVNLAKKVFSAVKKRIG